MHLFDTDIASGQDLFGSEPSLILNAENVYYRSSTPKVLSAPGRVLWYVSAGNKLYQGSMCVKACSYLDDVEIGTAKQLFSKYKKLGIYKWKDVYNEVADGDLNKDIMAFKFLKLEVFSHPISLAQLQAIWKVDGKNFNNAVSPLAISKERFLEIYNLGMKGKKMANNAILMSIRPQYANMIFDGTKTAELRRVKPKTLESGDLILVYVSFL